MRLGLYAACLVTSWVASGDSPCRGTELGSDHEFSGLLVCGSERQVLPESEARSLRDSVETTLPPRPRCEDWPPNAPSRAGDPKAQPVEEERGRALRILQALDAACLWEGEPQPHETSLLLLPVSNEF